MKMNNFKLNKKCPCKRKTCPRHGDCIECKLQHKKEGKYLTACERLNKKNGKVLTKNET